MGKYFSDYYVASEFVIEIKTGINLSDGELFDRKFFPLLSLNFEQRNTPGVFFRMDDDATSTDISYVPFEIYITIMDLIVDSVFDQITEIICDNTKRIMRGRGSQEEIILTFNWLSREDQFPDYEGENHYKTIEDLLLPMLRYNGVLAFLRLSKKHYEYMKSNRLWTWIYRNGNTDSFSTFVGETLNKKYPNSTYIHDGDVLSYRYKTWPIFYTGLHPPFIPKKETKESKKRHDESIINRWHYCWLSFAYWTKEIQKLEIMDDDDDLSEMTYSREIYIVTFSNVKSPIPENVTCLLDKSNTKRRINEIVLSGKGKWGIYVIYPTRIEMLEKRYQKYNLTPLAREKKCYSAYLKKIDYDCEWESYMESNKIQDLVRRNYWEVNIKIKPVLGMLKKEMNDMVTNITNTTTTTTKMNKRKTEEVRIESKRLKTNHGTDDITTVASTITNKNEE